MTARHVCLAIACLLVLTVCQPPAVRYEAVTPERAIIFPRDHFAHRDFRTEWWYHTGHLETEDGGEYGFEVVFFRHRTDSLVRFGMPIWKFVNPIYFAHFAITDETGGAFHYAENVGVGAERLGGDREDMLKVWAGDWQMLGVGDTTRLHAAMPDGSFAVDLILTPQKAPVVHGVNGVSTKGRDSTARSYYMSVTRYEVAGELRAHGERLHVKRGQAWMDHEIFSEPLSQHVIGWDWFSLQLDDDREVMAFLLRRRDGSVDADSAGTFVFADGRAEHLGADEFVITELQHWTSPHTGTVYPTKWRLRIPKYDADLTVTATLEDQELIMFLSGLTYWEGSMRVTGRLQGRPTTGRGYVEMSGRSGEVSGL
ncbi:MAG: lipocalin-like domain-containing protein [Candidatus Lernaella stagnicola]|nr:lipocalin-like domain-containing protein [Candidatus Lernaella stagnicola]